MTITSIRQVNNNADFTLLLLKKGTEVRVPPETDIRTDVWLPWCNNQREFDDARLDVIALLGQDKNIAHFLYHLWQKDDQVYFVKAPQSFPDGRCVPLNCSTGGDRLLDVRGSVANVDATTIQVTKLPR